MKLVKFIGKGIRGYLNHTINFRDSVTFLIGVNGSGKTSVLKLINGITQPSYRILESIDYSSIELHLIDDGKSYVLSSSKTKEEIVITFNHDNRQVLTDSFLRVKPDNRGMIDSEDFSNYSDRFNNLASCRAIKELSTPLFIGIDRMPDNDVLSYVQNSRRLFYLSERRSVSAADKSLIAIQEIVYDLYRKNAARQKQYSEDFRSNVLKETLGLLTSNDFSSRLEVDMKNELKKYESRSCQFLQALQNAGIEEAENVTEGFFNRLRETLETLSNKNNVNSDNYVKAIINWYVSKSQLDKIDSIISHEEKYESNVKKLNEQFSRFIECVNLFFQETGKEIKILDNGLIKVSTNYTTDDGRQRKHQDEISALSSGEKQVVALIGLLIFTPSTVRPEVLIIDEPELSLHLTWQEIFVDAILKAQPNFQFVLATHSPTIISKIERRSWCEDLSKKNNG